MQLLDLTPAQLSTWKAIEKIDQAWFLLRSLIAIVIVFTAALIVFLSLNKGWAASGISGALDGVFGVCLLKVTDYHFPNKINIRHVSELFKKQE